MKRMSILARDGLTRSQQLVVNGRAEACFGSEAGVLMQGSLLERPRSTDEVLVGGVYAVTLRYLGGYVPNDPKEHDISMAIFRGGHAQPRVLVAAAMVTRRVSLNQVEVRLDSRVMLSYGSGPRFSLDRYILHKDGDVRYWDGQYSSGEVPDGDVCEWTLPPRWEFTQFPVLPSVVEGV